MAYIYIYLVLFVLLLFLGTTISLFQGKLYLKGNKLSFKENRFMSKQFTFMARCLYIQVIKHKTKLFFKEVMSLFLYITFNAWGPGSTILTVRDKKGLSPCKKGLYKTKMDGYRSSVKLFSLFSVCYICMDFWLHSCK